MLKHAHNDVTFSAQDSEAAKRMKSSCLARAGAFSIEPMKLQTITIEPVFAISCLDSRNAAIWCVEQTDIFSIIPEPNSPPQQFLELTQRLKGFRAWFCHGPAWSSTAGVVLRELMSFQGAASKNALGHHGASSTHDVLP